MKYIFILITALFILGCGDSSSSSAAKSAQTDSKRLDMQIDKTYTVFPGDSVKKDTEDTVITISKNSKETESYVTLKKGKAHIEFK